MVKKKEQAKISNGAVGTEMVVNGWVREVKCIMSVTGPIIEHIESIYRMNVAEGSFASQIVVNDLQTGDGSVYVTRALWRTSAQSTRRIWEVDCVPTNWKAPN